VARIAIAVGAILALALGAATQATGQSGPPPCSAGVSDQPTLNALDEDEFGSNAFVATHTIKVSADFGSPPPFQHEDDSTVVLSAPAGTTTIAGKSGNGILTFFSPAAGAVPIAVTWTQSDGTSTGTCRGSATIPLQLQAATPTPHFKNLRAVEHLHPNLKLDTGWSFAVNLGPAADLDPVQVKARGVRKARLPGSNVPFKISTIALRSGDPGFNPDKQYRLALPGWQVSAGGDHSAIYVKGQSLIHSFRNRPLGYEVELLQDGRLLVHLRLAGTCNAGICKMRIVKVQL
jgi:hypothetical protein